MMQFYKGSNNEYIEAAYATSGRSTCRACKQKIAVQSIRLSYNIPQQKYSSVYWHHLNCFELKPKFKDIDPMQEIYNIDQIDGNATDMDLVINYIEAEKERIKRGEKRPKTIAPPQKDEKEESEEEKEKEKEKPDAAEDIKGSKKDSKKKKQEEKQKPEQSKQSKQSKVVPGYTEGQQAEFDELVKEYSNYTIDKLKQMLAANSQTRTGTKPELVERCADGKVLGQIPHCLKCGGGRPKFDKLTATYKCPGYMDDDKYRHCHKTFSMSEVNRVKWVDI